MINLNEIDVNELVLKLSKALFNVLDCEAMRDIECAVECSEDDLENIYQMSKIVKEISFEKKFIPLNLGEVTVCKSDGAPDGWFTNNGELPLFEGNLVDVIFYKGSGVTYEKPANYWDWTIDSGNTSDDIKFWRYSKS